MLNIQPPGPNPVVVTLMNSGTALPFTNLTGQSTLGQITGSVSASMSCTGSSTKTYSDNESAGPASFGGLASSYSYAPGPVACSDLSSLNFSSEVNGFIGAFTGDTKIRIELPEVSMPASPFTFAGVARHKPEWLARTWVLPWRFRRPESVRQK